jgi:hypothetical protein
MTQTLYISGPMRGMPFDNYPAFRECARWLRDAGLSYVDPSEHFEGKRGLPRFKYLAADVERLITECHVIVLLCGWQRSEGAQLEAQIGLNRGYDFYGFVPGLGLAPLKRKEIEEALAE